MSASRRSWTVSSADLVTAMMYFATSFDLVNGYPLQPAVRVVRSISMVVNLVCGVYALMMLKSTRGNCEPNEWAATLGDWLPHLSHGSRIHIYSMISCMVITTFLMNIVPMIKCTQGKINYVDYVSFFFSSPNRFASKEDKFVRLMESYTKGERFQLVGERYNHMTLLCSPCLFWHKKTFDQLDKRGRLFVSFIGYQMIVIDTFVTMALLYMSMLPVKPDSPYLWQVLEDPLSHKIRFEDDLCQVKPTRLSQVLYCVIILAVMVHVSIGGFVMCMWLTFKVSVMLSWTATVSDSLAELIDRRTAEHLAARRTNDCSGDAAAEELAAAEAAEREDEEEEESLWFVATVDTGQLSISVGGSHKQSQLALSHQHEHHHHHHDLLILAELRAKCESLKYRADYRNWLELEGPRGFPKSTELLEAVAQNELLALMLSIKDSDQYVSVLNFSSLACCCLFMSVGMVSYRQIEQNSDLISWGVIMVSAACVLGACISSCALVNSRLMKLHRKLRVLIALMPASNYNRTFWEGASAYWFTRTGLKYGYSILGLVNSSWTHCFQVTTEGRLDKRLERSLAADRWKEWNSMVVERRARISCKISAAAITQVRTVSD